MKILLIGILIIAVVLAVISKIHPIGKKVSLYIVLGFIALIMLIPFYMMFVMATHTTSEIYSFPPAMWFGTNIVTNLKHMIQAVNFPLSFLNSCIVTFGNVILVLFFCSIGGYAFAVYQFPGRKVLFAVLLGTMMVPWTAGIIPWFIMMSKLGWLNSFQALIIPSCANAFGIFWMRQYCQNNVPVSLVEAARIDGCSEWTIFFRVIAPILKPAYASLGIM